MENQPTPQINLKEFNLNSIEQITQLCQLLAGKDAITDSNLTQETPKE